jgi:hypothetical protein
VIVSGAVARTRRDRRRIRSWSGFAWAAIIGLSALFVLAWATSARAFSTAPHVEIMDDAMVAEGFGPDAIGVMDVNNTYMDLYQYAGAAANPISGSGDSALSRAYVMNFTTENWPVSVIAAASRSHFDTAPQGFKAGWMNQLGTTAGMNEEWARLQRSVYSLMREAAAENDPQKALAVLGESLHQVQDFYAHSNWLERKPGFGGDGPDWLEQGFGSYPTWFDVPASERAKFTIYGDSTPGHRRHGDWNSDGNINLNSAMNKDSPPRPYYLEAAITAYFATRQWVQAAESWVGNARFWHRMQTFHANGVRQRELDEELSGLFEILLYSGRWEGQGSPFNGPGGPGAAGDLLSLRSALKHFFEDRNKTVYRSEFEHNILRLAEPNPLGQVGPVPSSQELQKQMQVVVLRVKKMASVGALGLGDPWPDQADMYALMHIDGQPYHSDVIHGHNEFSFGNPYEPFTKFKVIPTGKVEEEPVESVEAVVRTANVRWAGTNDDVCLRLNPRHCFPLEKRAYDDFEQGDSDRYSVPIDEVVRRGFAVGDIQEIGIEKSADGIAGGWKLGGLEVFVNRRPIYDNQHVEKWFEDNDRRWTAPDFTPSDPVGNEIPIWLDLREDDYIYGADDQGDVNPKDNNDTILFGYTPGQRLERTFKGGNELGGRLGYGGDRASITILVQTLIPQLIGEGPGISPREESPTAPPPLEEARVTVPEVRGLPLAEAEAVLRALGLRPTGGGEVIDSTCMYIGVVATQMPFAGNRVAPGTGVSLSVGVRDPNPIHYCK